MDKLPAEPTGLDAMELARREESVEAREAQVRLREAQLDARAQEDTSRLEREHLALQIRDVNEQLVLASLRAQALADDADAARGAADDIAERFRSLVLTSSSLVWRASAAGRLELDRDLWCTLTGMQLSDADEGWLDAIHALDRDRVRAAWADAVSAGTPYACQHRIRARKGGFSWVASRAVPIRKAGLVKEWIGMMTDVTDRVRVEEARDRFIGILGHDLRSPLGAIISGLELLGELPAPFAKTVSRLVRSADRIHVIVRDMLDFARGRLGGGIPISPRPCDLGTVCHDVVEESKQAHATRAISFEGSGDLRGEWDPDRMEQVLSNLLGNAVEHGSDPIVVTALPAGDQIVASVHNGGEPIPEALLPTLFEPFTRGVYIAEESPAVTGSGLGLGLYIANEIVHAHGGTLSVSSSADLGTTFTIAIPRIVPRRMPSPTGEHVALAV